MGVPRGCPHLTAEHTEMRHPKSEDQWGPGFPGDLWQSMSPSVLLFLLDPGGAETPDSQRPFQVSLENSTILFVAIWSLQGWFILCN
jgi:hypothetical protein